MQSLLLPPWTRRYSNVVRKRKKKKKSNSAALAIEQERPLPTLSRRTPPHAAPPDCCYGSCLGPRRCRGAPPRARTWRETPYN